MWPSQCIAPVRHDHRTARPRWGHAVGVDEIISQDPLNLALVPEDVTTQPTQRLFLNQTQTSGPSGISSGNVALARLGMANRPGHSPSVIPSSIHGHYPSSPILCQASSMIIDSIHEGHVSVDDNTQVNGVVTGHITVRSGSHLQLNGVSSGDVTVESEASALLNGTVNGNVFGHGTTKITGVVTGTATGEGVQIASGAIVNGRTEP